MASLGVPLIHTFKSHHIGEIRQTLFRKLCPPHLFRSFNLKIMLYYGVQELAKGPTCHNYNPEYHK